MKHFQTSLSILVSFAILAACPIFSMDFGLGDIHNCAEGYVGHADDSESVDDSEKEGILQRYFGSGSFAF